MKKWRIILAVLLYLFALFISSFITVADSYHSTTESIDSLMPESQRNLVHNYSEEYCISEELLQSLIFCESSYQMSAVNEETGCYGICQINPAVWGYGYDTESKQIRKCCEMLISYLEEEPDIAYAIARYNGQSDALLKYESGTICDDPFVSKVLNLSYELEELHGKHNY